MVGQLGQVPLDVAEGDAVAVLVGVAEQVGGDQLGTLDHTHGHDRRPATARTGPNTSSCRWTRRGHNLGIAAASPSDL